MNKTERYYELSKQLKDVESRPYLKTLRKDNKLHVRERLDYLLDPDTFVEDGLFARYEDPKLATDAVVTGIGKIDGRPVCIMANDMTIKAGTWGKVTIEKIIRIQEKAIDLRIPIVYLIDSAGARLDEQFDIFIDRRHAGMIFRLQGVMSGVVPQISGVFGPSTAGSAYIPALSDCVIMVEGNCSVYLGSPRMAEMVTGEKVSMEEMGGARMHCQVSGLGDYWVEDDYQCLDTIKKYLEYMPQNWEAPVPMYESCDPYPTTKDINEIVPENEKVPFDVMELINGIVDAESWFPFKEIYAPELVTGFARLGGRTIGIIANQSMIKAGVLFPESADKGAHFIALCNAYGIPMLYLVDISGFMIGSVVERNAIIRRGAKWLNTIFNATVPRIGVILRKAYGAGYLAMSGASCMPDYCVSLVSASPAIMGPEAAVNAMHAKKIAAIEDPAERAKFVEEQRQEYRDNIDALKTASKFYTDAVVAADELRDNLIKRFNYVCLRPVAQQMLPKRNNIMR